MSDINYTRTVGPVHHDGHGLNERITILADERDPSSGGASHHYLVTMPSDCIDSDEIVAEIHFQHGPRNAKGSRQGITEAALIAVLLDRLEGFQAGPYSCRENALTKTKLEEALHWSRHRADARARRGVLGKNKK